MVPGREGIISDGSQAAASGADQFAQAYHALRSDPSVQFNLIPPQPPPKSPAWLERFLNWVGEGLRPIGSLFKMIGRLFPDAPYAQILLWIVIGSVAAVILVILYNRVRHGEWNLRLNRRSQAVTANLEDDWIPDDAGARSWLEEADALAREGRFAEAIHHLLFRSVEDIARRRPALVRPSLTSRELASADGIPARARELFSGIARLVERSLFGGRAVGESDWLSAREDYADFALASTWRR
jgi:hypothetical protein